MDAATVGLRGNAIVLGKHSGRHALRQALEELGFAVDGQALNTAFKRFKEIADRKKSLTAMDLEALVTDELRAGDLGGFELESFEVHASSAAPPRASVVVSAPAGDAGVPDDDGGTKLTTGSSSGDGPIDAIFRAVNAATGVQASLREFHVERRDRGPGCARRGLGGGRGGGPDRCRTGCLTDIDRGGSRPTRGASVARARARAADGAGRSPSGRRLTSAQPLRKRGRAGDWRRDGWRDEPLVAGLPAPFTVDACL